MSQGEKPPVIPGTAMWGTALQRDIDQTVADMKMLEELNVELLKGWKPEGEAH